MNNLSPDEFYEMTLKWKTIGNTNVRCNGEGTHVFFPKPYSRQVMIGKCNCNDCCDHPHGLGEDYPHGPK